MRLPVESIIHDRQDEYYNAINASNNAGNSTKFIEFMLSSIKSSLIEAIEMTDEMTDEIVRWDAVQKYLFKKDNIKNSDVCRLINVSPSTATRLLRAWTEENKLDRMRIGKTWAYILK